MNEDRILNKADDEFPDIKTGNGLDRDLAATTNDRLKKSVIAINSLGENVKSLKTDIQALSVSSSKDSRKVIGLTLALFLLTVVLVIMTGILISDGRKAVSNQDNIALTQQFFNTANTNIINAMENNEPILQENKGPYTDAQLDNYLGDFDIIQSSYDSGLLSEDDFCDDFSYYIQLTDQNAEVQKYIAAQERLYPGSFTSLIYLSNIINKSKDSNCK